MQHNPVCETAISPRVGHCARLLRLCFTSPFPLHFPGPCMAQEIFWTRLQESEAAGQPPKVNYTAHASAVHGFPSTPRSGLPTSCLLTSLQWCLCNSIQWHCLHTLALALTLAALRNFSSLQMLGELATSTKKLMIALAECNFYGGWGRHCILAGFAFALASGTPQHKVKLLWHRPVLAHAGRQVPSDMHMLHATQIHPFLHAGAIGVVRKAIRDADELGACLMPLLFLLCHAPAGGNPRLVGQHFWRTCHSLALCAQLAATLQHACWASLRRPDQPSLLEDVTHSSSPAPCCRDCDAGPAGGLDGRREADGHGPAPRGALCVLCSTLTAAFGSVSLVWSAARLAP